MGDLDRRGDLDVKIVDGTGTSTVKATVYDVINPTPVSTDNPLAVFTVGGVANSVAFRYNPRFHLNKAGISVPDSIDTTLFTYSGDGQLDFISINFSTTDAILILSVDGTEIFRENVVDIDSGSVYDLKSSSGTAIFTKSSNHIVIDWNGCPADFVTSFTVKARAKPTKSTSAVGILIKYRVKI